MAILSDLLNLGLPTLLLLIGTALIVAEAFAPGAHFFVAGAALLAAGIVGILVPVGGVLQILLLTAVVLVAGVATLYGYRQFDLMTGSGQGQTSDSDSLRGQTGRVTERVTPQEGEVKLDDGGFNPYYRARSVDGEIAEGEEVMVVDPGGGNVITVEAVGAIGDEIDRELARGRDREPEAPAERTDERGGVGNPETESESEPSA
jgi:membrane protein implicated in regulation of membrane protease activity